MTTAAGAAPGPLSPAARALLERRAAAGARIPRRDDPSRAPLSFAQQRLWLLDRMEPGNTVYVRPKAFHVAGPLDVAALGRALTEIVARHEALRSAVALDGETPYARILPPSELPLPVVAVERGGDEAVRERLVDEARTPFDLARGPFVRASLLRAAPDDHTLLLTLHHIATDGWSDGVLLRELGALYGAFAAGQGSALPDLPVQYGDYAAWQRERLAGARLEHDLSYWTGALAGAPAVLELPADRPRPAVRGTAGERASILLPDSLAAAVAALAREAQATPFMVLLAAWQTLLARYAGRDDVVVGVPVAGRTRAETEGLIGMFVNTLALRAGVGADRSFRELLAEVRRTTLDAYAHQELPFDRLVEALRPARSASHTPVVQAMFNYRNDPSAPLELPGLAVRRVVPPELSVVTDIALGLAGAGAGLRCRLDCSAELFAPGTSERLLGYFRTLLEGAVQRPDTPVARLPLLTAAERAVALSGWTGPAVPYPADRCVHDLVADRAARAPGAAAVESADGATALTYAELVRRSRSVAARLRALGVAPGDRVAVCVERSPELIVALLGVLEAGAAYVPLDPDYPAARLALLFEDATPRALVATRHAAARLPTRGDVATLFVDDAPGHVAPTPAAPGRATPEDVAYVIYTSGSTGRPKGVEITHRSLVNYAAGAAQLFGFEPADRVLQFATVSFDTAVREIFATLVVGGTLVLRPAGPLASLADTLAQWTAQRLTIVCLPTAFWHELVTALADGGTRLPLPPTLRTMTAGGERMRPERVALWRRVVGGRVRLFNNYGPTETTVTATAYEVPPYATPGDELRPVPIGRPLPNVRVYVLDARGDLVAPGAVGDLFVGGAGVARGYLNRPDLTAERFSPDPFSGVPGARMYRTGDRVRQRPDGLLEYVGRDDDQVKIRGYRVEPAEAEGVLARHPAVRECAVAVRDDGPGGASRLVAYVVPGGGARPSSAGGPDSSWQDELRTFLRTQLPDYAVPGAVVALAALPLMPNGKVDRAALPAPAAAGADRPGAAAAEMSVLEEEVALLWGDLLGVAGVGRDDDFFDLGGHSLIAVAMADHLTRIFGPGPWLAALLEEPTVAHLARVIDERRGVPESPVFRLRAGAPGVPPLFFLHGDYDGGGLYTRALARHLDPARPLHVVHPTLPGGPATIEAMADFVLPHLREAQPRGPYFLGGHCNGGLVAFELARRLSAAGERVAFLLVVDVSARNLELAVPYRVLALGGRLAGLDARRRDDVFLAQRERLIRLAPRGAAGGRAAGWTAWIAALAAGAARAAARRLTRRRAREESPVAPPWRPRTAAGARRGNAAAALYARAMGTYFAAPYVGRLTLVASSDWAARHALDPTAGWSRVCAAVEVRTLPGDHITIITSQVDALGAAIRAAMDEATRAGA